MARRKYTSLEIQDFTNKSKGENHDMLWKAFVSLNLKSLPDVNRFCSTYHVLPPGDYTKTGFNAVAKAKKLEPIQSRLMIVINALEAGRSIPKSTWDSIQKYLSENTSYQYVIQGYETQLHGSKRLMYGEVTSRDSIAAIYISFLDAVARALNSHQTKEFLAHFNTCTICNRRYYYKIRKSELTCSDLCTKDYRALLGRKNYKPKTKK